MLKFDAVAKLPCVQSEYLRQIRLVKFATPPSGESPTGKLNGYRSMKSYQHFHFGTNDSIYPNFILFFVIGDIDDGH